MPHDIWANISSKITICLRMKKCFLTMVAATPFNNSNGITQGMESMDKLSPDFVFTVTVRFFRGAKFIRSRRAWSPKCSKCTSISCTVICAKSNFDRENLKDYVQRTIQTNTDNLNTEEIKLRGYTVNCRLFGARWTR